jgi:hypothetical protein
MRAIARNTRNIFLTVILTTFLTAAPSGTLNFIAKFDNAGNPTANSIIFDDGTKIGIGTTTPSAKLNIDPKGPGGIVIGDPNTGSGGFTSLLMDISGARDGFGSIQAIKSSGSLWGDIALNHLGGNVGIGTRNPAAKLDVAGMTRTSGLQITGGSDLAESFEINGAEAIKPGMVVAIDPDRPGDLRVANKAYDRTVAGIVSGANKLNPGLILKQQGTVTDGSVLVSLTGRVYCWLDASHGPIAPGDLLTTSDVPGHAMKVTDHERAQGAILGKAMSSLRTGRGLVLVLVTLQ